jgi:hypothetical protein
VAEAAAEAGMPNPLTVVTAISATTEAAATRTAAEATEAAVKGGQGSTPEAATGLAGRRPLPALVVQIRPRIMCLNSNSYFSIFCLAHDFSDRALLNP